MRRCLVPALEAMRLRWVFCVMVLNDVCIFIAIDLHCLQLFHALIPFSLLLIGVDGTVAINFLDAAQAGGVRNLDVVANLFCDSRSKTVLPLLLSGLLFVVFLYGLA